MSPFPILFLLATIEPLELAVLAMPFREVRPVRALFVGIPMMVVAPRLVVDARRACARCSGERRDH